MMKVQTLEAYSAPPGAQSLASEVLEETKEQRQRRICRSKMHFTSKDKADAQVSKAWTTGRARKLPVRSYKCQVCHGWHMTSQPLRTES